MLVSFVKLKAHSQSMSALTVAMFKYTSHKFKNAKN